MLFLSTGVTSLDNYDNLPTDMETASTEINAATQSATSLNNRSSPAEVLEDEVDRFLWKQDGKIYREMNPQLLVFHQQISDKICRLCWFEWYI